jgi:predicted Zn-dependent peptidase
MTYQAELEAKIDDLTPDRVVAAMRNHLDPQKLVIVTAGDFGAQPEGGG